MIPQFCLGSLAQAGNPEKIFQVSREGVVFFRAQSEETVPCLYCAYSHGDLPGPDAVDRSAVFMKLHTSSYDGVFNTPGNRVQLIAATADAKSIIFSSFQRFRNP